MLRYFLLKQSKVFLTKPIATFIFLFLMTAQPITAQKLLNNMLAKIREYSLLATPAIKMRYCRNRLTQLAQTEYIAWMDADDISLPQRLAVQIEFMERNPHIDIVGLNGNYFGNQEGMHNTHLLLDDHSIKTNLLLGTTFLSPSTIFRMRTIRKLKLNYSRQFDYAPDYKFFVDCCPYVRFANIDKPLYRYRVHDRQITTFKTDKVVEIHIKIVQHHLITFNIKADKSTTSAFLSAYAQTFHKIKPSVLLRVKKIMEDIYSISHFYQYSRVNRRVVNEKR